MQQINTAYGYGRTARQDTVRRARALRAGYSATVCDTGWIAIQLAADDQSTPVRRDGLADDGIDGSVVRI